MITKFTLPDVELATIYAPEQGGGLCGAICGGELLTPAAGSHVAVAL